MESEHIHEVTLSVLEKIGRNPILLKGLSGCFSTPPLPVEVMGLAFPNPVGLAAGMDKKAQAVPVWKAFGFGFSELGGVTQHAQPGNAMPRMFRAVADRALINRMGFNNPGCVAFSKSLEMWKNQKLWPGHPVGINLGKSKITPLEEAGEDYATSLERLYPLGDFFVVNVSSPNTPQLRKLQDKTALTGLIGKIVQTRESCVALGQKKKPLLIKVAPDMDWDLLDDILDVALNLGLEGIVATNTTLERPATSHANLKKIYAEEGGLSGAPLKSKSTEFIRHIYQKVGPRLTIIGVGGVFNAEDAWEKIAAGASLVQVYTGLVYEGPAIARQIVRRLQFKMKEVGMTRITEVVGLDHRA